jgi:hypothetical protein
VIDQYCPELAAATGTPKSRVATRRAANLTPPSYHDRQKLNLTRNRLERRGQGCNPWRLQRHAGGGA